MLQRLWPGDFDYGLRHGGPALATWIALVGGAAALVAGASCAASTLRERHGLGAAAAALLRAAGVRRTASGTGARASRSDPHALSPRLVHRLRTVVPKGAVVIAPVADELPRRRRRAASTSSALPVPHVANTKANDPYGRARAVQHWVLTNDPRVARRYGATWAIRSGRLYRLPR